MRILKFVNNQFFYLYGTYKIIINLTFIKYNIIGYIMKTLMFGNLRYLYVNFNQ